MVHENSILAYYQYKPKIAKKYQLIIDAIKENGKLDQHQMSDITGMLRHLVSARCTELMYNKQWIKIVGTTDKYGTPINVYDLRSIHDKWNSATNSKEMQIEALEIENQHLKETISIWGAKKHMGDSRKYSDKQVSRLILNKYSKKDLSELFFECNQEFSIFNNILEIGINQKLLMPDLIKKLNLILANATEQLKMEL